MSNRRALQSFFLCSALLGASPPAAHAYRVDKLEDLDFYKEENQTLPPVKQGEKRIVFFGDSIVNNIFIWLPEHEDERTYINRAVSGQTTQHMLARFYQDVVALHPSLALIFISTNDVAGNNGYTDIEMIKNNIRSMVDIAKQNHIPLVLGSPFPTDHYFWNPDIKPVDDIAELHRWSKSYAAEQHITYLDNYTALKDDNGGLQKKYRKDSVHPNGQGYKVILPLLKAAITEALK